MYLYREYCKANVYTIYEVDRKYLKDPNWDYYGTDKSAKQLATKFPYLPSIDYANHN